MNLTFVADRRRLPNDFSVDLISLKIASSPNSSRMKLKTMKPSLYGLRMLRPKSVSIVSGFYAKRW